MAAAPCSNLKSTVVMEKAQQSELQLVEGSIQQCDGYLEKRSKHLFKRWKKKYCEVFVGEYY